MGGATEKMIPIKCKICYHCSREEEKCYFDGEQECIEDCEEFQFEPLYLVDFLEDLEDRVR